MRSTRSSTRTTRSSTRTTRSWAKHISRCWGAYRKRNRFQQISKHTARSAHDATDEATRALLPPESGYADDLTIVTGSVKEAQAIITACVHFADWIGLQLNPGKCQAPGRSFSHGLVASLPLLGPLLHVARCDPRQMFLEVLRGCTGSRDSGVLDEYQEGPVRQQLLNAPVRCCEPTPRADIAGNHGGSDVQREFRDPSGGRRGVRRRTIGRVGCRRSVGLRMLVIRRRGP
jgi:hypothetical protein